MTEQSSEVAQMLVIEDLHTLRKKNQQILQSLNQGNNKAVESLEWHKSSTVDDSSAMTEEKAVRKNGGRGVLKSNPLLPLTQDKLLQKQQVSFVAIKQATPSAQTGCDAQDNKRDSADPDSIDVPSAKDVHAHGSNNNGNDESGNPRLRKTSSDTDADEQEETDGPILHKDLPCHICKSKYWKLHHFYDKVSISFIL